jgi:hypothetical protein
MRANIAPDSLQCMVQAHTPHAESGHLGTKQPLALSYQASEIEECGKVMNGKVAGETCKTLRRQHPLCQL